MRMLRKSFKLKILLPAVVIFIILVVILNVFLSLRFNAINSDLISEKLMANANSLSHYLENSRAHSRAAAVSMSRYTSVVNAIRERDREELLHLFTMAHDLYSVNYFTITDGEGIVLARTHDTENYGDSVINQQNIIDAMEGRISSYYESGTVVKVSIRTGAPVYDTDGTLIGVISAGVRFDTDSVVKELSNLLNADVSVFLGYQRIATTIYRDGINIAGTTMDPRIANVVLGSGLEYSGEVDILGERYIAHYKPLINAQGVAYATFFTGTPIGYMMDRSNMSIRDGIILGLAVLAVSIFLLYIIISKISKPVTILLHSMTDIANGNLDVEIDITSEDEIGVLGKSLKKVADILHKLLEEIKNMISEHETGNIDHYLNPDDFSGGYKVLANDIVTLATVSTKDQLTGIPNRRSFDNRLDLEWNRAMRDKTSLSIMMMDLDHFKNYNDTFGHRQGDLALQTIAASLTHLLKRSTDFAARWGGEEFVVLLPVTDSEHAQLVAESLRSGIEQTVIPCVDNRADKVTISIGLNTQIPTPGYSVGAFLAAADEALYEAKKSGRNRVAIATKLVLE